MCRRLLPSGAHNSAVTDQAGPGLRLSCIRHVPGLPGSESRGEARLPVEAISREDVYTGARDEELVEVAGLDRTINAEGSGAR